MIEVASSRKQIIHYQELCDACGLKLNMQENPADRAEIGWILGETSEHEYQNKRPLLSAVVVSKSGYEGDGFYKLGEELGITKDWRKLKQDEFFSIQEINNCSDFWRDDQNYSCFFNI